MRFHNTSPYWGIVLAVALVCIASIGCDSREENPYEPKGQLRQKWSADGDRIPVYDAADEIAFKFRRRSRGLKVYGTDLTSVGFVRTPRSAGAGADTSETEAESDAGGRSGTAIRVRPVGETAVEGLERRRAETWAIEGTLRLEQTADGWAVFDADGNWVGRFSRNDEQGWRLATDRSDSEDWRVVDDGEFLRLKRGGETRYRAPAGAVSETTLLALALEDLPVLYRVAVGEWLAR